ncbi:DNA alkylation repair protein (plasmid) [Vibrio sp. SS-MA-C1-2]|uniref:DNA alkylation repair protein n=1 Tax=Vibrio sp. SS-MA-C1-2 TaxID=2908646 RepID=UPI001F341250|nr:DNA alkylation repair protein [Vibrio sp. SS-MA-C1-2]UJF20376.1 DNA alkylation repair protein [Vibrio sp. SS-MA-C1-2]
MTNYIEIINDELSNLSSNHDDIKTSEIRKVSSKTFRLVKGQAISDIFDLCDILLNKKERVFTLIAFDWAFKVRAQYDNDTFVRFEYWLFSYINDWWDCDDFCTHAFGYLLSQKTDLIEKIIPWASSKNFAVRRAIPVILILSSKRGLLDNTLALKIVDLIKDDPHYLVQKGYGWLLKTISEKEPEIVKNYLTVNVKLIPRVAFRYAVGKLNNHDRQKLMAL